jgi:chorismate mutase
VEKIKNIKSKEKIKTYDPKREQEILSALCQENLGPLSKREIQFLFRTIIRFFRLRQRNAKRAAKTRAEK